MFYKKTVLREWYKYDELVNWFVYTVVNRFHVKSLGYTHNFMSISISQLKDHYISLDQASYATYVVEKYLDTSTKKENSKFDKTTLPHNMIFSK